MNGGIEYIHTSLLYFIAPGLHVQKKCLPIKRKVSALFLTLILVFDKCYFKINSSLNSCAVTNIKQKNINTNKNKSPEY